MYNYDKLFIGGDWVDPATSNRLEVNSPATLEPVGSAPEGANADMDRAVTAAREAFDDGPWPRMSPAERADFLAAISAEITGRMDEFATLISNQNGSPYFFSQMGQVYAATAVLDYYAGLIRDFAFEEWRTGMMGPVMVRREPVGVAGAIVPWNVPLFTLMLKLAPALAAGATVVAKPSPETPLDSFELAGILEKVGLPKGVVNIVPAGREVGEYLVRHPGIDKIAFTGSTAAGRKIGAICGEQLKRVTLELGGKSAGIILDDADLEATLPTLLQFALMNNGQACVAQTRILAPKSRYSEIRDALADAIGSFKVGDPLDMETECGPMVAERQQERVLDYIDIGKAEGAKVVVGGGKPAGFDTGWFVEPTLFENVDNSMKIAQEEIFGPVITLLSYDDVDHAVAIANDSDYGLSGSVYTTNPERGLDVAKRVRTGTYAVNNLGMDFGSPFGGFKNSGIGRELGPEGLAAYLEAKSILMPGDYVAPSGD